MARGDTVRSAARSGQTLALDIPGGLSDTRLLDPWNGDSRAAHLVKPSLLQLLACPACGAELEQRADESVGGEVETGLLNR